VRGLPRGETAHDPSLLARRGQLYLLAVANLKYASASPQRSRSFHACRRNRKPRRSSYKLQTIDCNLLCMLSRSPSD
jgi:hypothetical protein